ncbi:hypothetical protein WL04_21905 [Burkholderia ubonensis]|nr:hypothetical protein WM36_24210 [Burkholderia ubonensis]KVD32847.1 hypothetical protein WI83_15835 [Burkholderia ubonensis]KVP72590.1 hypothetical protein WJ94_24850 [Burkholderia ubonensis]KVR57231.1 hypothetical protein WK19_10375 [Burkholderia ubonensis]KVR61257.1 hypothetical protein WK20_00130 [Burkholderia ubonensis]
MDASGKTTLLNAIADRYPDITIAHWKQFSTVTLLPDLLPDLDPPETLRRLGPNSRAAQFCYLAALEYDMIIRPALAKHRPVIVDSYWYKFAAKMKVLDMAAPFLYSVCQSLPKPEAVLFLDTPIEIAHQRKREMNFFECNGRPADFVPFQRQVRAAMLNLAAGVPLLRIDGREPLEALIQQAVGIVHPEYARIPVSTR